MNKFIFILGFIFGFPIYSSLLEFNAKKNSCETCKEQTSNQIKELNINAKICDSEALYAYTCILSSGGKTCESNQEEIEKNKNPKYEIRISSGMRNFIKNHYKDEKKTNEILELIIDHELNHIHFNHFKQKKTYFLDVEADLFTFIDYEKTHIEKEKLDMLIVFFKTLPGDPNEENALNTRIRKLEEIQAVTEKIHDQNSLIKFIQSVLIMERIYKNDSNVVENKDILKHLDGACNDLNSISSIDNNQKKVLKKTFARCKHLVFFFDYGFHNLNYHGHIIYPDFSFSSAIGTKGSIKEELESYKVAKEAYFKAFETKDFSKITSENDKYLISSFGYLLIYDGNSDVRDNAKKLVDSAFSGNEKNKFFETNRDIVHALLEEKGFGFKLKSWIFDQEKFFKLSDDVSKANRVRWLMANGKKDDARNLLLNLSYKETENNPPFIQQLWVDLK